MRNQDDEASSSEHSDPEGETNGPTYDWRNIVRRTVHDLFDRSWIQNLMVGMVLLFVSPLVVFLFMQNVKGMLYGFGVGVTILFWIGWLSLVRHAVPDEPSRTSASVTPTPTPVSTPTPAQAPTPMNQTNITSHNQSGGFTGINQGTINFGPEPRNLSSEQGHRMIKRLASQKPTAKINFSAVIGDEETKRYAEQINRVLIEGGFEYASTRTIGMAVGVPSGITIYVHDAKSPPSDAVRIADCLKAEGLHFNMVEGGASGSPGGALDANTIGVYVATRPTL